MSPSLISAGVLQLCIGTVYAGTMTAGSPNLAIDHPGFTAADVGRTITVIGAGPNTGDPFTGSLLKSTILTYTDSQHVVLADNATTAVGGGNSNATVYRPLSANVANPIQYNRSLTSRDTLSFSYLTADFDTTIIEEGSPFWLRDTNAGVDLLGGTIDQVKAGDADAPGVRLRSDCECVGWDYLFTKRYVTPYRPELVDTLINQFKEIINYSVGSEGITVTGVTGPSITVEPWDFVSAYDALDKLCELASDNTDKYTWYIDPWKVVHVVLQGATSAPWSIDDRTGSDANAYDREGEGITVTWTREKLANRVYVKASRVLQPDQVDDAQQGDGGRTYSTKANIEQMISLDVDGVSKTFGVKGVDTGKDWYYTPGSSQFEQDAGGSLVNAGHWIHLSYYTSAAGVGFSQNDTAVNNRAEAEGGTGFWDAVVSIDTLITQDSLDALAAALAAIYGDVPQALDIVTPRSGLDVAQLLTVHLNSHNVNADFLIDSVSLDCTDNIMTWTIHAANGALIGDYRSKLINIANGGGGGSTGLVAGGGGGGSNVAATINYLDLGTISAPTTILGPTPTDGFILIVHGVMDATGHAVTWDSSMFKSAPDIDTTPSVWFTALFVGAVGVWKLCAPPIVGVPA